MAGNSGQINGSADILQKDLLPKLPVPNLQSTLEKYLSLMKTVLTSQQYSRTKYLVDEFTKSGGVGEKAQEYVIKQFDLKDNWSYDWWLEDMYMKIRLGLPINSNPGGLFPTQTFKNQTQHLQYAAKLLCGILDFKAKVDNGLLIPERASHSNKGQLLCMDQWYRFLSSFREPGVDQDIQRQDVCPRADGNNVIVACRNRYFKLNCGPIGTVPSIKQIFECLNEIVDTVLDEPSEAPPIGILSSADRDQWAKARLRLLEDPVNQASIKDIETSCMLLCLDKQTIPSDNSFDDDIGDVACLEHVLHGQGSKRNSGNRWFDVTFQLIVAENGTNGFNYQHSICEGMAVVDFCEHALVYEERTDNVTSLNKQQLAKPKQLKWNVSTVTLDDIQVATQQMDGLIADVQLSVLNVDTFGREFPKKHKMSPDSFIQLALQLTHYKIHGTLVSTYESASVRRFRYGRVDVIRGNSPAALEFVRAMVGEWQTTDEDKFALMKDAILWQSNYMKECIQGYGIDLHILGLREACKELNIPLPGLFTDDSYRLFNNFALSTSQVGTKNMTAVCYGAVVPEGYGVCYNPRPSSFYAVVTSFRRCLDTDSTMFANSLEASLLQMQGLCERCDITETPNHQL
ncbi:hypothetical protein SNE40_019276 [Patella caerulea]|uniref:Choline O-acetyltransferase n=1 Tax=Patella caerulea TaxID=87958 RepID=A0AAN8PF53_PATCE